MEGSPQRLKVDYFFAFQPGPNLFKSSYDFLRIQLLSTMQADLSPNSQHCGVVSSSQKLLDFLSYNLASTDGTLLKRLH